jgi:hypothetical protein
MARHPERLDGRDWAQRVEVAAADATNPEDVARGRCRLGRSLPQRIANRKTAVAKSVSI